MNELPKPASDSDSRPLTLLDRYPATPEEHIGFLEFVRDEAHIAVEAKRQQLPHAYANETIERMVRSIKWAEARERLAALSGLPSEAVEQVARVFRRQLTIGTVEQIDDLLQPAVRALRDAFEHNRAADSDSPSLRASHTGPPEQKTKASDDGGGAEEPRELQPFTGGTMVFFGDRVELCGADICSWPRSQTRRKILELLRMKQSDGKFVAYSSKKLAEEAGLKGGINAVAGAIRDVRDVIVLSLRSQADIECDRFSVILSGGPGYRFADCLSVQEVDEPNAKKTTDMDEGSDVRNVGDDVADVRNEAERDVRNVRSDVRNDDDRDVRNVPDTAARRTWILQWLAEGQQLKAPAVAKHFGCSMKTAERDLTALKEAGCIEYVGSSRSGYYRLRKPPESDQ